MDWLSTEARTKPNSTTRQTLRYSSGTGWDVALDPAQTPLAGEGPAAEAGRSTTSGPTQAVQGCRGRLRCIAAAAFIQRQFASICEFFPERHALSLLCHAAEEKVAYTAERLAAMVDSDNADAPPAKNRSAAILFFGFLLLTVKGGRGAAFLARALLFWSSRSGHDRAAAASEPHRYALPADLLRRFLACILVLLRHEECGEEVLPVHDAIEAELERIQVMPRDGFERARQLMQEAVAGPGGIRLTPEQQRVSRLPFWGQNGEALVARLLAFAGAAKTTILRHIVSSYPDIFFVVVMFNSAVQVAVQASMRQDLARDRAAGLRQQENFEVLTSHALVSRRFRVNQKFPGRKRGDVPAGVIRTFLAGRWRLKEAKLVPSSVVIAVRKTVERYMMSADSVLDKKHLVNSSKLLSCAEEGLAKLQSEVQRPLEAFASSSEQLIVAAARGLWDAIRDPKSTEVEHLPHNAYLKLYALSKEVLTFPRRTVLLVDEAQDLNAVTAQVLIDKQELPVVLVGDPRQQIYAFNGAFGLMDRVTIARLYEGELVLRQTFRFGPEIAAAVNTILKAGHQEPRYVVGRDSRSHPGVVYALVPRDKTLDTVTYEDVAKPSRKGRPAAGTADYRNLRLLQCGLRRLVPDAAFPVELEVTPLRGVAILPPGFQLPPNAGAGSSGSSLPRLTYVARTNAALIKAALELVALGFTVCGSFAGADWDRVLANIEDIVKFLRGDRSFHRGHELHGMRSEEELVKLVEAEGTSNLATAYTLAKEYSLAEVKALGQKLLPDRCRAEYYLVTTHKMKGEEAPVVQLADDFFATLAADSESSRQALQWQRTDPATVDEINCVYVAATRPRCMLLLNRDVTQLVLGLHRRHVELVLPSPEPVAAAAGEATAASGQAAAAPGQAAATVAEVVTAGQAATAALEVVATAAATPAQKVVAAAQATTAATTPEDAAAAVGAMPSPAEAEATTVEAMGAAGATVAAACTAGALAPVGKAAALAAEPVAAVEVAVVSPALQHNAAAAGAPAASVVPVQAPAGEPPGSSAPRASQQRRSSIPEAPGRLVGRGQRRRRRSATLELSSEEVEVEESEEEDGSDEDEDYVTEEDEEDDTEEEEWDEEEEFEEASTDDVSEEDEEVGSDTLDSEEEEEANQRSRRRTSVRRGGCRKRRRRGRGVPLRRTRRAFRKRRQSSSAEEEGESTSEPEREEPGIERAKRAWRQRHGVRGSAQTRAAGKQAATGTRAAGGQAAAGPKCPICSSDCAPLAKDLPYVAWRGRALCRTCAGRTLFGEVLELAEARGARQGR